MITEEFIEKLSSNAPVPGGGGVAALVGSLSSALCSMVANLTTGKKKYAQYQADIERIIEESSVHTKKLYSFIEKDAEAFEPLSKAYGIPKDTEGRDEILEKALYDAAIVPMELTEAISEIVPMLSELSVKGSRLAISDVAVAAALCEAAVKSAVMNVYVNTGLMKNRETAGEMNNKAANLCDETAKKASEVYKAVMDALCKE